MVGFNADMITRALFVNAQAVRVASPRFFIDGNVMTELLPAQSSSAPPPAVLAKTSRRHLQDLLLFRDLLGFGDLVGRLFGQPKFS